MINISDHCFAGYDNQCFSMTEVEEDVLSSVHVVRVERRRRSSDPEFQGTSERGKLSTLSLPEIVVEVMCHPLMTSRI